MTVMTVVSACRFMGAEEKYRICGRGFTEQTLFDPTVVNLPTWSYGVHADKSFGPLQKERSVMINEREFYGVVFKDAAVEAAWLAANVAFFEAATTPHGIRGSLARIWRRRTFGASVSNLLREYDRATGVRHRASDLAALRIMVAKDVADRDRTRLVRRLEIILEGSPIAGPKGDCETINRRNVLANIRK